MRLEQGKVKHSPEKNSMHKEKSAETIAALLLESAFFSKDEREGERVLFLASERESERVRHFEESALRLLDFFGKSYLGNDDFSRKMCRFKKSTSGNTGQKVELSDGW